jgi:hypothetical protein
MGNSREVEKVDGSINDWAVAIRSMGAENLAFLFEESVSTKLAGQKTLKELNLPHLRRLEIPLTSFLQNPERYFRRLKVSRYFASLIGGSKRVRALDLNESQVGDFIAQNVGTDKTESLKLLLSGYFENLYGGNIVIGAGGNVYVEVAEGTHGDLVTGRKTPTIFGIKDPYLKTLGFYKDSGKKEILDDSELEQTLFCALRFIPKDNLLADGKMGFHPGYYEFIITKDETGLSPIFIDYRDDPKYQL